MANKSRGIVAVIVVSLFLAACGGGDNVSQGTVVPTTASEVSTAAAISATMAAQAGSTAQPSVTRSAPSPTATLAPSPTATPRPAAKVGDKLSLSNVGTIQVYSLEWPVTPDNSYFKPDAGMEFAAIDIEQCASASLPADKKVSANPFNFQLVMADNTRARGTTSIKEPALHDTSLLAGDCVRGWASFQVPQGMAIKQVVYDSGSAVGKWDVPAS